MLDTARKNGTLHSRCLRLNGPFQHSARWVCSSWTLRLSLGFDLSIPLIFWIFWMTIWICHEKSFRSHEILPQDADLSGIHWSEANWRISRSKPTQPDFFSCKTHETVWKHKFGESTTTFSNFQCHLLMHFSFSSKMGWFPVYLRLTLIIMDLLLIYLLFTQRVSFGPANIRNRLSPPPFQGREIMSKKAMANALAKQAQPSACRTCRAMTSAELNMSSLKGNEWHSQRITHPWVWLADLCSGKGLRNKKGDTLFWHTVTWCIDI